MSTFSLTRPRVETSLHFTLKPPVMACLVLVMQLWCLIQIVTFQSRRLTLLCPMHQCRICTMILSMLYNTCTMQPTKSITLPLFHAELSVVLHMTPTLIHQELVKHCGLSIRSSTYSNSMIPSRSSNVKISRHSFFQSRMAQQKANIKYQLLATVTLVRKT